MGYSVENMRDGCCTRMPWRPVAQEEWFDIVAKDVANQTDRRDERKDRSECNLWRGRERITTDYPDAPPVTAAGNDPVTPEHVQGDQAFLRAYRLEIPDKQSIEAAPALIRLHQIRSDNNRNPA